MPTLIRSAEAITHPADWDEVQLGDVATFHKGSGLSKASLSPTGRYPCILYGELFTTYGAVIDEVASRTDTTPRVVSRAGDVLMPTSDVTPSGLAKASAVLQDGVALGGDILVIRPDPERVVPEFLAYAIRADARQVLSFVRGSTVYHLYASDMRNFSLRLPPVGIQKEIAQTLQDFNQFVESLDELIEKKRNRALGVTFDLVNCERRLAGHQEPWRPRTIASMCSIVNGGTPSSHEPRYWNGGIPWCTPTDITSTRGPYLDRTERTLTSAGVEASSATVLPVNSLLLCTRATIGAVKIAARPMATNQGVKALICEDVDPVFLYYKLLTMKPILERLGAGSTFLEVSKSDLASIVVKVPPLPEQRAVAEVLSDMDAEIDALVAQRDKTAQLKQAMMQELLTGRTRLS